MSQEMSKRNIELKAGLRDRHAAMAVCERLGAEPRGDIRQVDTYFGVAEGRFKLRESEPGDDYLVFYHRPDVADAKACDYTIAVVPRTVKPLLAASLGILAVVEKIRTLFLWENDRIHLDQVTNLGDFIEFEAVLSDEYDDADGHRKLARLREAFGIEDADVVAHSYLELIREGAIQ